MRSTGYEPLNTLKSPANGIWLIDGPAIMSYRMPIPTRATVVQLENGDLWVHAPTVLTDALKGELDALGPVRHLIVPNWRCHASIPDWRAAYPEAVTWAAPGAVSRAERKGVTLHCDHELGPQAEARWSGQIEQMIVEGSRVHHEVVFFHRQSETLVVTDLIRNFETAKLPVWMRPFIWVMGVDDSDGKMPPGMRMTFRKEPLADSIDRIIAWAPHRMILAHGRWYERDAVGELERAFRRLLRDRRWNAVMERMNRDRQG